MAGILRGEIRWADLGPVKGREQSGTRPVLILSHEIFNDHSGTVIALSLTSQPQKAGFPFTYELKAGELPKQSWVKINQVRTLSSQRIGEAIGRATPEELLKVIEGLDELIS